jgi:protein-disulfide isomerase
VLEKNSGKVKVVFKNFPLQNHEMAFPAALAAMAAHEQGKFWEFHDRLFAHGPNFNFQKIEEIARNSGLDMERFQRDVNSQPIRQRVIADFEDGREAGVRGTPTIFINGRLLKQRTPEIIQTMINEEHARAKQAAPGGKK